MINIKNDDEYCFVYCVLAALYPEKHNPNRPNLYKKYFNTLNLKDLEFPLSINQISKFEKQNNLKINVYTVKDFCDKRRDYKTLPIYISNHSNKSSIKSLYINSHYVLINKFESFLRSELPYNIRTNEQLVFCDNCTSHFLSVFSLNNHKRMCINNEFSKIIMPKKNSVLEFSNYDKMINVPWIIYADIEALNVPRKNIFFIKPPPVFIYD